MEHVFFTVSNYTVFLYINRIPLFSFPIFALKLLYNTLLSSKIDPSINQLITWFLNSIIGLKQIDFYLYEIES